jgi:aldose 1-epimerase
VERQLFGRTPDGAAVECFALANARGCEARVITYGGIVVSLRVPDRAGALDDVVLGHEDLAGYIAASPYFGAIVGRYGNRIAHGRFTLDGRERRLATNDGAHHLHGGVRGFDKVVWSATMADTEAGARIVLHHESPDGDEGYPGTLAAEVAYTLTEADELVVDYRATTDAATHVNLTQHSYFNLAGAGRGDILGHELTIHADAFVAVDATLVPTGELAPVDGGAFDFRRPRAIGARIGDGDEQLRNGRGYDHSFVLRRDGRGLAPAARLVDPGSGRTLDVRTTEPGLQLYSGNFLDGSIRGKGGRVYAHRSGLCLETGHFPDSPNQPSFPSTVLRPGEEYRSRTVFAFGTTG